MKPSIQKNRRLRARLDGWLFVVLALWLATSMLLVLLSHSGTPRALHPQQDRTDVLASLLPQTARTFSLY